MHSNSLLDVLELADLMRPTWSTISDAITTTGVSTCLRDEDEPLKDKLRRVENALVEARDDKVDAAKDREAAKAAWSATDSMSQDSDEFKAAQAAVAKHGEIEDRIADLQAVQVQTLRMLGKDAPQPDGHAPPSGEAREGWDSSTLLADPERRQMLAQVSNSKARFGGIDLGQVASRDALVADITGTTNMRRGSYQGITPQLRRRLRILDLIPTGTMDANTFPYTKESGSFGTAVETAEGTAKPEAALTLTDDEAIAATIAHWMKIRKQALADAPALQSIIDARLRYGVERRLEGQIIAGDGVGSNMRGILNTTGIGAVAFVLNALIADQILKGITTVYLADAEATGVVLHPTDWQTALLAKASGDGHYFSGGPFSVTPQQMWGVPLVPSITVPQGTSLVGDWQIGAMLLIREGVNVLLSDSDQADFISNRVTLLGEMRAALPVFRPPAFCTVALQ